MMGYSDVRERGIHCCVVHNWDSKKKFLATGQHGAPRSAGLFMLVVDGGHRWPGTSPELFKRPMVSGVPVEVWL